MNRPASTPENADRAEVAKANARAIDDATLRIDALLELCRGCADIRCNESALRACDLAAVGVLLLSDALDAIQRVEVAA